MALEHDGDDLGLLEPMPVNGSIDFNDETAVVDFEWPTEEEARRVVRDGERKLAEAAERRKPSGYDPFNTVIDI